MRAGAVLLVLALAGRAGAVGEVTLPPLERATLDNGLRVVVAEYRELPLVEIVVMVGAGAAQDPPDRAGLAALVAATLDRGAGARSAEEFARAVESLGGRVGVAAGTDGTTLTAEFLRDDFGAGLGLVRDMLRAPTFVRDEVRRAREQQLAALLAEREEPSAIADRCFAALLYEGHPYARQPEGTRATVERLGRGDVRGFYDRWYRPNGTIIVVVGDVDRATALAALRDAFGSWQPGDDAIAARVPVPPEPGGLRTLVVDKPDATQTQIRAGNRAIARRSADYVPLQVATGVLGGSFSSRLVAELRVKRGLTYGAASYAVARRTGGDVRLSTFTKTETTGETLRLLLDVADEYRRSGPTAAELAKVKTFLAGQFPLRLETPNALAARLAEIEFFDLPADELTTYRGRIAAVDAADARRVAREHLRARDAGAVVVLGTAHAIREQVEAELGPVRVVTPDDCDRLAPSGS